MGVKRSGLRPPPVFWPLRGRFGRWRSLTRHSPATLPCLPVKDAARRYAVAYGHP